MTRWVPASIVGLAVLVAASTPSEARHEGGHGFERHEFRGRGAVLIGPPIWVGPPPPVYVPPPYVVPPPVVVEPPPVYVQREPAPAPAAASWYYCPSARAYYPSVQTCPEPWVPVAPNP